MGMKDYSNSDPNDPNGNGGGNGPGGPSQPGPPSMGGQAGALNDVSDMLIDYNERYKNAEPTLFRDGVTAQMISVLIGKLKPNPLLVGAAGVGKTRIVEDLARRIEAKDPLIPKHLAKSTVYELPLANLVAGAGVVGQLEERLAKLVDFASDKKNDAILFIDEIHLIQDSKDPVYTKVAQILKPALSRGDMRLIGATTLQESRKFDNDPAFQRRFSRLIVDELTRDQTVAILKSARAGFLSHYKNQVTVTDEVLEKVATIADLNSRANMHRPDNALTLLDRAMSDVVVGHAAGIARADLEGDTSMANALRALTTLQLNETKIKSVALKLMTGLAQKEAFNKNGLVNELTRLLGQQEIIAPLVDALEREELGVFHKKSPTAWMLAGPSGVGKTETAKIVAQELTGQPPIILNMNEFHTEYDTSKIIGSPPGYIGSESDKEMPFDSLESNPHRVILLDELEKAHPKVHRLFLTALDEGWMRMASGKVVDFSKAIIIATTNAARESMSRRTMGFQSTTADTSLTRQQLVKALQEAFDPEFLGRFSQLVAYAPLNRELFAQILHGIYDIERARIIEENPRMGQRIPATIDDDTLTRLINENYVEDLGARPAEGAARHLIEDALMAPKINSMPATSPTTDDDDNDIETDTDLVHVAEDEDVVITN